MNIMNVKHRMHYSEYLIVKGFAILIALALIATIILKVTNTLSNNLFKDVAAEVFVTYEDNKVYDPEDYIQIDGKYYRTDCSGYVDAVLAKMNIIDTTAASNAFMEDKELKDALTNAGFTYAILTDAADITSTSIIVKSGLVAIVVPNNEYDEYTLYCWSSSQATVKSLSADQINEYGFTNIYSLTE